MSCERRRRCDAGVENDFGACDRDLEKRRLILDGGGNGSLDLLRRKWLLDRLGRNGRRSVPRRAETGMTSRLVRPSARRVLQFVERHRCGRFRLRLERRLGNRRVVSGLFEIDSADLVCELRVGVLLRFVGSGGRRRSRRFCSGFLEPVFVIASDRPQAWSLRRDKLDGNKQGVRAAPRSRTDERATGARRSSPTASTCVKSTEPEPTTPPASAASAAERRRVAAAVGIGSGRVRPSSTSVPATSERSSPGTASSRRRCTRLCC